MSGLLTDLETPVIAGIFTVIGLVAGYLLQDRQTTRQIRLRPLADRQGALKDVYRTMTKCFYALHEAFGKVPKNEVEYEEAVGSYFVKFLISIRENGIWISKVQKSITNARASFTQAAIGISMMSRGVPGGTEKIDFDKLSDSFGEASLAIAKQLGIRVLEEDLDKIINSSRDEETSKSKKSLPWRVWGMYVVLSLGNLLVLYLSSLLTSRSDWPLIDVVFFGAGLGVGLAILNRRRECIRHYVTIVAWLGVTLGGIVSGVFQRLTLTIAPLVGSDWVLLPLLGVLVVNNALLLRLIDYTREFGKSLKV